MVGRATCMIAEVILWKLVSWSGLRNKILLVDSM